MIRNGTILGLKIVDRDSHIWLTCIHTECEWEERFSFPNGFTTGTDNPYETGNGQAVAHGLYHIHQEHKGAAK